MAGEANLTVASAAAVPPAGSKATQRRPARRRAAFVAGSAGRDAAFRLAGRSGAPGGRGRRPQGGGDEPRRWPLAASCFRSALALSLVVGTPGACRHVSRTATVPAGTRDRTPAPASCWSSRRSSSAPAGSCWSGIRRCFRDRPGHGGGGQCGHGDAVRGARHPAGL